MSVKEFVLYLKKEKGSSDNTSEAYYRDITAFCRFLKSRGVTDPAYASGTDVASYMLELKNNGKSKATASRKLSSIKAYYRFLIKKDVIRENPAESIKAPRIERKALVYLSVEEVEKLLSLPEDSVKGIRDRAMLEVLYATGIRVSEIIELKLKEVNFRIGFITCSGEHGRARIVPMGLMARKAVENYISSSRAVLMRNEDRNDPDGPLFVNYAGEKISRQGFWKILKQYGKEAGLEGKITPRVLRTTFAVHMVQNGADLKSLQELMGNEDIMAAQIYLSVAKSRIKDVYDKSHPRA